MGLTYAQPGLLAEARGEPPTALDWAVRCVSLFAEFPHPLTGTGPRDLARLTAELGFPALAASWQRCTGEPLPDEVRRAITAMAGGQDKEDPTGSPRACGIAIQISSEKACNLEGTMIRGSITHLVSNN
jgi:hypothetical protein